MLNKETCLKRAIDIAQAVASSGASHVPENLAEIIEVTYNKIVEINDKLPSIKVGLKTSDT